MRLQTGTAAGRAWRLPAFWLFGFRFRSRSASVLRWFCVVAFRNGRGLRYSVKKSGRLGVSYVSRVFVLRVAFEFCIVSGCAPGFAVRFFCFCAIIQKYTKKSIPENFFIFLQPRRVVFPAGNNKKAAAYPCAPCRAFLGVLRRFIIVRSDFVYCDFAQITRFANALILCYNINNQKGAPLPRGRWRVEYTGGQDWRPDPVNQFCGVAIKRHPSRKAKGGEKGERKK